MDLDLNVNDTSTAVMYYSDKETHTIHINESSCTKY